jgi:hypothetical protein
MDNEIDDRSDRPDRENSAGRTGTYTPAERGEIDSGSNALDEDTFDDDDFVDGDDDDDAESLNDESYR